MYLIFIGTPFLAVPFDFNNTENYVRVNPRCDLVQHKVRLISRYLGSSLWDFCSMRGDPSVRLCLLWLCWRLLLTWNWGNYFSKTSLRGNHKVSFRGKLTQQKVEKWAIQRIFKPGTCLGDLVCQSSCYPWVRGQITRVSVLLL